MTQNNKRTVNREDEEIELMDYLVVLWKRKWLIIAGTLACAIVAGIVALSMTNVFRVSTLISVGRTETGFVEEESLLLESINSIPFREKIAQKLSLTLEDMREDRFFQISPSKDGDILLLKIIRDTADPDRAIKILGVVNEEIIKNHHERIQKDRKTLQDLIAINESKIRITEVQIEALQNELQERITLDQDRIKDTESEIETLKKEISDKIIINEKWIDIKIEKQKALENQLAEIEEEIKTLKEIRNSIIERKLEEIDVVGMVAYFNDLQARFNSAYSTRSQIIDQIPSQIQSYYSNIVALEASLANLGGLPLRIKSYQEHIATLKARLIDLNGLPFEIESYKEDIIDVQIKLNQVQETEIINPPHSSGSHIAPSRRNIVAVAGALGLLVFVFLVFFLEYIEKYRGRKLKSSG